MFKKVHLALLACVFGVVWLASGSFTTLQTQAAEQVRIAFQFTPVPTATTAAQINTEVASFTDQFTVQLAATTPVATIANSAEIPTLPQTTQLNKNERPRVEPTITSSFTARATFVRSVNQTRIALSSLTYLLNVADADGILTCSEIIPYYEQTAQFNHYALAETLETTYDYYMRSMNIATIGVNQLYRYCLQQLALDPPEDEIAVRKIKPAAIWETAVADSNSALYLNNVAVEWLNGSTRLLSSVYNQFDRHLQTYQSALAQPTLKSCETIRRSFEHITLETTRLDLGSNSEFRSSYSKYTQAADLVYQTSVGLYDYCDPTVAGMDQVAEQQLQTLPHDLVESAEIGIVQAQALMLDAHFYISPESLVTP